MSSRYSFPKVFKNHVLSSCLCFHVLSSCLCFQVNSNASVSISLLIFYKMEQLHYRQMGKSGMENRNTSGQGVRVGTIILLYHTDMHDRLFFFARFNKHPSIEVAIPLV